MKNARDIKNRIKTIKNIAKVTKTMELISAARMKSATKELLNTLPYTEALNAVLRKVRNSDTTSLNLHGLLSPHKEVNTIAVLLIGPHKGYVGNLIPSQTLNVIE